MYSAWILSACTQQTIHLFIGNDACLILKVIVSIMNHPTEWALQVKWQQIRVCRYKNDTLITKLTKINVFYFDFNLNSVNVSTFMHISSYKYSEQKCTEKYFSNDLKVSNPVGEKITNPKLKYDTWLLIIVCFCCRIGFIMQNSDEKFRCFSVGVWEQ